MVQETLTSLDLKRTELVFGLVGPLGTDLHRIETFLQEGLQRFQYLPEVVKLSDFLRKVDLDTEVKSAPEAERIRTSINAGNELRKRTQRNDIFALYAAQRISSSRSVDAQKRALPHPYKAHVIHSLKHPDEVRTLRSIYGQGFFLIGVFSPESVRLRNLVDRRLMPEKEAIELVDRDENEKEDHGQHTRDVFEMSDVFIPMTGNEERTRDQLHRFVELVFGAPHITPTQDEHGMFLAFSAALRSGSLARQVGAVVTNAMGDVLAVGANDAPRFGGGQYWPGPSDFRDIATGSDANDLMKRKLVIALMRKMKPECASKPDDDLFQEGRSLLKDTGVMDITEYSRDVHAEMAAFMACARTGVSTVGTLLYTTTFPCHNCAKHIVAAGVKTVHFVEPYPKSHAAKLHGDSLLLSDGDQVEDKVVFKPFVGVGPRRFFDLFSMKLSSGRPISRKTPAGDSIAWPTAETTPRIPLRPYSYLENEVVASEELFELLKTYL
ncbi:anti-phage dCTP deaminase [Stigmatella sp. ncwal1]|uniref:Anti-phage dCTP deaminase n=1 Tax=Stigmatella ashevillensis TaxID=2995309 RepID=A0ABT5DG11_9BACT|nr:anti-phage dCTP deaminase [Stigmatella ashevillena]MDC0712048.1 anti-phage dCTP deaminase [Stigmatella ashevillena]